MFLLTCTLNTIPANAQTQGGFWGRLTWDTIVSGEGETRFRYGNWYGPGWWGGSELSNRAGGLPPVDALDAVAQKHDFGYEIAEKLGKGNKRLEAHYKALADIIAVRDSLALPADPKQWKPPARDPGLARKYRERIALGFPNYQQRLNELKSKIPSRVDPSHPETLDWFVDGKPPLNEKQLEELMKKRVRSWNQDYEKRKAKKNSQKYAGISKRTSNTTKKAPAAANNKKLYAWILKTVVDDNGKKRAELSNTKSAWKTDVDYSRGSALIKMTWTGPTDNQWKIPHVHGASISMKMQWSEPPKIVYIDREVSLKVSVALAERSHQWPNMNGKIHVQILSVSKDEYKAGAEIGKFYNDVKDKPREYWFETSATNNYKVFDEVVFAKLRTGYKTGDLIGIRVSASNGGNGLVSTLYVYEWADVKTSAVKK